MRHYREFIATGVLLLLSAPGFAQAGEGLLRSRAGNPPGSSDASIRRSRLVEVNHALLDRGRVELLRQRRAAGQAGLELVFNLFEDVTLRASVIDGEESADGSRRTWTGRIAGSKHGEFVLVTSGGLVSANLTTDTGARYQIRPMEGGHIVTEIDPARFPMEAEPQAATSGPVPGDDFKVVRLMVLYSGAARQAAGGPLGVRSLIDLALAETNQGYANSGLLRRVQLVYVGEVPHEDATALPVALSRLSTVSDGFLDNVHALRARHEADVVSLWVDNGTFCGGGTAQGTFNVLHYACAAGNYSLGHELGHQAGYTDASEPLLRPLYSYRENPELAPSTPFMRTVMGPACGAGRTCPRANYLPTPTALATGGQVEFAPDEQKVTVGSVSGPATCSRSAASSAKAVQPEATCTGLCTASPATFNVPIYASWTTSDCKSPYRPSSFSKQYSFSGQAGDRIIVTLDSTLDTILTVEGPGGYLWQNDDYAGSLNSRILLTGALVLPVTGTYIIDATTFAPAATGDFRLQVFRDPPVPVTPAPGTVLPASNLVFSWTPGAATQYDLEIGTQGRGSRNIFDQNTGSSTSAAVSGLPTGGGTLYVRLWGLMSGGWMPADYTYTACCANPQITSPAPSTMLPGTTATFSWTAGTAVLYHLQVGTTGPGATDIFDQHTGSVRTAAVTGLPNNGAPVYVRLWGFLNGLWQFVDYVYVAFGVPQMSSPTPGSILASSSVVFNWTAGTAGMYHLQVGTTAPGSSDVFNQNTGTTRTATVSAIPLSGGPIYVRLWGLINGVWRYVDYIYIATSALPQMTSPLPGSILSDVEQAFSWSAGTAAMYHLQVGTSGPGSSNVYNQNTGTSRSVSVAGLPANNGPVYVRLWGLVSGVWQYTDYTYTACSTCGLPRITVPSQGSQFDSTSVTFQWTAGAAVMYHLEVGTAAGGGDIYSQNVGTARSATVTGLPITGAPIYVRLWGLVNGIWQYTNYTYNACFACDRPQIFGPTPNTTLPSTTVQFTWSSAGASNYWLLVGTNGPGSSNIYNNVTSATQATVTGLPTNGTTVCLRLQGLYGGAWRYIDYVYRACTDCNLPTISLPVPGSTLTEQSAIFQWTQGNASMYHLAVGTQGPGSTNIFNQNVGAIRNVAVGGLPANASTIYVRLWGMVGSTWRYTDFAYTACTGCDLPQLQMPQPGSTITGTSANFVWTTGGAGMYHLSVGTAGAGSTNVFNQNTGTATSVTVTNLPNTGPLYVRLWGLINGVWRFTDYVFTKTP